MKDPRVRAAWERASRQRDTELGNRLTKWRSDRRLSSTKLARQLGISRQRLWEWESEGVPRGLATIVTLAMQELSRFK